MDSVYADKFKDDDFFSDEFVVGQSLSEYSKVIGYFKQKRSKHVSFNLFTNINPEEFRNIVKRCNPSRLWTKTITSPYIPDEGYNPKFSLYDPPNVETDLEIMKFTKEEEKRGHKKKDYKKTPYEAELSGSVNTKYRGETELNYRARMDHDDTKIRDLSDRIDGMVSIQVRSYVEDRDYIVTQEFIIPTSLELSSLKDRILCREDFQPANPSSEIRKFQVNKFGMFYIGNTFYLDGRWGKGRGFDYSKSVIDWTRGRDMEVGESVRMMENTKIEQLSLRLGFLYLYQHQGNCQHHIVFTDARLMNSSDLPYSNVYPLMMSFANLAGKYCCVCTGRIAKWVVTDCDLIPFEFATLCNWCYFSYLFDSQGNRKRPFLSYKYVDRNALL